MYKILFATLFAGLLSACDGAVFGIGVDVPVGDNGSVGISTNTNGETKVQGSITVGD